MCGRFGLSASAEAVESLFGVDFTAEMKRHWVPREEITPGTGIVAIVADRDRQWQRYAEILHWGLVPHWAKDPEMGRRMINARSETVASKPAFRDAFRYRRCLVPASGFYEWDRRYRPSRRYWFTREGGGVLALAGIWDHWQSADGSEILSVALLTRPAEGVVANIHDRMPVILPEADWESWLVGPLGRLGQVGLVGQCGPCGEGDGLGPGGGGAAEGGKSVQPELDFGVGPE